jgi:hypothetical protein
VQGPGSCVTWTPWCGENATVRLDLQLIGE